MPKCISIFCFSKNDILFRIGLWSVFPPLAHSLTELKPNSAAMEWVRDRVYQGEIADLKKVERFANEKDRVLSASFLEDLLSETLDGKASRIGIRISNAIIVEPINLDNIDVKYEVWIENCQFRDSFIAIDGHFNKTLSFEGTQFNGSTDFDGLVVGKHLFFRRAVFRKSMNLRGAEIGDQLISDRAEFNAGACFNGISVGDAGFFRDSVFKEAANFVGARFERNLKLDGARFLHKSEPADFNRVEVGSNFFLRKVSFSGPLVFMGANIVGQFVADGIIIKKSDQKANFNRLTVGNSAFFRDAVFDRDVSMTMCSFMNLWMSGAKDTSAIWSTLDISEVYVKRVFRFDSTQVEKLYANAFAVDGKAEFQSIVFKREASFEHSNFKSVEFYDVTWPEKTQHLKLDGMKYENISFKDSSKQDNSKGFIQVINKATYSPQSYRMLENVYQRSGYPAIADETFAEKNRRERKENYNWYSPHFWWSCFLDIFFLYGRSPGRAMFWSAIIIVVGLFLFFDESGMERFDNQSTGSSFYNPFWYSLDLFLPMVDLKMAKHWRPNSKRIFAKHYSRIQIILGWMFIPIALLSLTGLIKISWY